MTNNTFPDIPLPPDPEAVDGPAEALIRPQALKKWSSDLIRLVDRERATVFDDHDFAQGVLTRADLTRTLKKMTGCGSVVELRAMVDRGTGEIGAPAVHAANFCGQHTICPFCAARVQDRRKARFREPILNAARVYKHAYLVTATIPPVPAWRDHLQALLSSWQAFRKMGQKRTGRAAARSAGEWGKVKAGISKIEIKRGDGSGLPHCHVHALFFTDEYLDFRVWSPEEKAKARADRKSLRTGNASKITTEWHMATDGRATSLDVKRIKWRKPKPHQGEGKKAYAARLENWSMADSVYEQSREVLKYATKFDSAPETGAEALFAKDFIAIKSATYGRRLFQTYGAFRGVGGDDFTGSAHALKEKPVIYEARWRSSRYSELMERSKPVFANREPGPHLTHRLQILNRVQGATRRLRGAINAAKFHFLQTGELAPVTFCRRDYLEGGGFSEVPIVLELPSSVVSRPGDLAAWEGWIDDATTSGRTAYAAAREDLDNESHFRITPTPQETASLNSRVNQWFWVSDEYRASVVRAFHEILAPSSGPP